MSEAATHQLVITRLEDDVEWEVIHDSSCPTEPWINDLDGNTLTHHTCAVGQEILHAGLDGLSNWEQLSEGRHEIRHWSTKTSSGPWGPEYDAGLELVR